MIVHGGDVWQVGEELGIPASELLDFSANINPRGLPPRARERLARDACRSSIAEPLSRPVRAPSAQRFKRATCGGRRCDCRGTWGRVLIRSDFALPAT